MTVYECTIELKHNEGLCGWWWMCDDPFIAFCDPMFKLLLDLQGSKEPRVRVTAQDRPFCDDERSITISEINTADDNYLKVDGSSHVLERETMMTLQRLFGRGSTFYIKWEQF